MGGVGSTEPRPGGEHSGELLHRLPNEATFTGAVDLNLEDIIPHNRMPRRKTDLEPQGGTIVTRRLEADGRVGGRMEEAGEAETPEAVSRGHTRWAPRAQDEGRHSEAGLGEALSPHRRGTSRTFHRGCDPAAVLTAVTSSRRLLPQPGPSLPTLHPLGLCD